MKYLFLALTLSSCQVLEMVGEDSFIEEMVEDFIQDQTGVALDITGNSLEPSER